MRDPRYDALAELALDHSLRLEAGKVLRIDADTVAAPLVLALHREAIKRGLHAYAALDLSGLKEILVAEGSDEQLEFVSPMALREMDGLDASITIWSETNTRSFSRADTDRRQRQLAAERQLAIRRRDRIAHGEHRWLGTLCPTEAHAQDAAMSLDQYEDFYFRACHVHDADPVGHWARVGANLQARATELDSVRELRIVGEDTDLTVVVDGRSWRAAHGRQNMPDGEVYTSPVETETEGEIRFTFPALFQGREVDDIRLRFEGGVVVAAEAARGGEFLDALLGLDDGARRLGEVAFGMNYEIDRFTKNTLFDEKIGGTMHVALGSAFKELGGVNDSALHWDLVCDLRAEGEVYADGELVWRAGRFLEDAVVSPAR
jgi:aminopeptidase